MADESELGGDWSPLDGADEIEDQYDDEGADDTESEDTGHSIDDYDSLESFVDSLEDDELPDMGEDDDD